MENRARPGWDQYFMNITAEVGRRSSCLRRQIGAIIVREKRIIATGYNGAPPGVRSSMEIGSCLRDERNIPSGTQHEICRGLHAEQNAILQAARFGTSVEGATLYCTHQPCSICAKIIIGAGIREVKYVHGYPDEMTRQYFEEANIDCIQLEEKS
ncbi:cytidine/deoxycytidylate deaminase family protein [Desulfurispirillum indicum]|uniref:CMP/dCMP deaminase zinc-binding protein n=1 Tax=Desulfurispirillum indicum (strain ATCC BAA-1389 / DSM 22839 / S5) TaxID=653733 RepID=E6W3W1_DESIS|nr:cytidine/deoxycytidylate deaminase family protein [Desulfurispirillum indicum]ADU65829.1 CMP/dCMP deaminase zinc-binding protein [Desulfurispirillum indicum S5]UCZ57764.1 cytidine/deoxycytidylate deaminase family protein [Desulfurispirillum indicum]